MENMKSSYDLNENIFKKIKKINIKEKKDYNLKLE